MPEQPYPVHISSAEIVGLNNLEAMSVVTQAMWRAGVDEGDILAYCEQVKAAPEAGHMPITSKWVRVTP